MKFGTGKIGFGSKKKYFRLVNGENVYRIIPPFGPMADSNTWAVYNKVHFGYYGLPNPKTGKAYMRAFVSPEVKNFKNNMIEVVDPANERIRQLKEALSQAKERGDTEASKQIVGLLKRYNLDSKWHVNAVNLQGEIGLLKIPHKAYKALEAEIVTLRQQGIDPLSPENGRFFVFKRTGEGFETQYSVNVYKQKIEVQGLGLVEKDIPHVLTQDLISKLGTINEATGEVTFDRDGHNLLSLYATPTAEQVARMVKEGPTAVEEILGKGSQEEDEEGGSEDVDSALSSGSQSGGSVAKSGTQASAPVTQTQVSAPTQQAATTASAPLAAPTQSSAAVKTGGMTFGSSTPTTSGGNSGTGTVNAGAPSSKQSPEEFLKSIGLVS